MMNSSKKMSKNENWEDAEEPQTDDQNDDLIAEDEKVEENDAPDMEEILAENQKLKDDFLRAYAEAENVKKRCQQELEKNVKFAVADFAKNLLPVADNLQRALDACEKDEMNDSKEALRKGIELTQSELMKVFDKFGIKKMDIIGEVFDPNFHQVVQEVEDKTKAAGTVIAEVQTGYMIHDRILREAMVIVAK